MLCDKLYLGAAIEGRRLALCGGRFLSPPAKERRAMQMDVIELMTVLGYTFTVFFAGITLGAFLSKRK